jgi:hypothetical protein
VLAAKKRHDTFFYVYLNAKVERSGENLAGMAGEKFEDFETHYRIT